MKKILFTAVLVMMLVVLGLLSKIYAGSADTLKIYASGPSLDEVINSDTTSSGVQKHSVYKLVSRDTTYIYLASIIAKSDYTIIGELGSDGRPPCIQAGLLSDGSLPGHLFIISTNDQKVTIKNIYIFGLSINNTWNGSNLIRITGDNVKLSLDNVITSEWHGHIILYTGKNEKIFITNSKFRNGTWPNNWFAAMLVNHDYHVTTSIDSLVIRGCTMFCLNSGIATGVALPSNYFEFTHNSMIYNFQFTFQIIFVMKYNISNNLFYSVYSGGVKKSQFNFFYYQKYKTDVSAIEMDTLRWPQLLNSSWTFPSWDAEAMKHYEVHNNAFFEPQALKDFWVSWNSTAAPADSLITCVWMNGPTRNQFNDKTHWPNLHESGNIDGQDPQFGPSILKVLDGSGPNTGVGLLNYVTKVRSGKVTTEEWGYEKEKVSGDNWIPIWPLPEAHDMKYSNATVKNGANDGMPIGDPSWFGIVLDVKESPQSQLPDEFKLYEAYPNPFNPSTTIKFSLVKSGNVSLKVYNVMGQLVKTVVNDEYKNRGNYEYQVNMNNLASGVYFYTLTQGNQMKTKKMILIK